MSMCCIFAESNYEFKKHYHLSWNALIIDLDSFAHVTMRKNWNWLIITKLHIVRQIRWKDYESRNTVLGYKVIATRVWQNFAIVFLSKTYGLRRTIASNSCSTSTTIACFITNTNKTTCTHIFHTIDFSFSIKIKIKINKT